MSFCTNSQKYFCPAQTCRTIQMVWIQLHYVFLQAHVFQSKSGACAAFLANYNPSSYGRITFNGMLYDLPPWSISILPGCKTTVFNTARVRDLHNRVTVLMFKFFLLHMGHPHLFHTVLHHSVQREFILCNICLVV